jgi:hypothetical protein
MGHLFSCKEVRDYVRFAFAMVAYGFFQEVKLSRQAGHVHSRN